jgi:hypothetical protein
MDIDVIKEDLTSEYFKSGSENLLFFSGQWKYEREKRTWTTKVIEFIHRKALNFWKKL